MGLNWDWRDGWDNEVWWVRKVVKCALKMESCLKEDKARKRDYGNSVWDSRQVKMAYGGTDFHSFNFKYFKIWARFYDFCMLLKIDYIYSYHNLNYHHNSSNRIASLLVKIFICKLASFVLLLYVRKIISF